jgi:hypothetical protein
MKFFKYKGREREQSAAKPIAGGSSGDGALVTLREASDLVV